MTEPNLTVDQDGRAKAYRPLPEADRRAAFEAGLAAYRRRDFFAAHELLEPAWMGTADPSERSLHQGLIKLAAAGVHAVRGNPLGLRKNLVGARARLASVTDGSPPDRPADASDWPAAATARLDLAALVRAIDERLARIDAAPPGDLSDPPRLATRAR